jgi:hypothetical protein
MGIRKKINIVCGELKAIIFLISMHILINRDKLYSEMAIEFVFLKK